jgi:hypothetical protein
MSIIATIGKKSPGKDARLSDRQPGLWATFTLLALRRPYITNTRKPAAADGCGGQKETSMCSLPENTNSLNSILVEPDSFFPHCLAKYPNYPPQGYHSRSAWKKLGRTVQPEAVPAIVYRGTPIKVRGVLPWYIILEDLGNDCFLIAQDSYQVFAFDQTEANVKKAAKQGAIESREPCFARRAKQGCSYRAKRRVPTGVFLSVPRNLVIPESHQDVENEIFYYCHSILQGTYCRKHDLDGSTRINRQLMQDILGSPRLETKARRWLLENRIISTDHVYSKGNFSKSYWLSPKYAKEIVRWEVTKPRLAAQIRLHRLQRPARESQQVKGNFIFDRLVHWSGRLSIDLDACTAFVADDPNRASHLSTAGLIGTDQADYTLDEYGRFHAPHTRLFTPLRQFLSMDGQCLMTRDIRNSQIVFFAKLLKESINTRILQGTKATNGEISLCYTLKGEYIQENHPYGEISLCCLTKEGGIQGNKPKNGEISLCCLTKDKNTERFIDLTEKGIIYDHLLKKAKKAIPDYLQRKKDRDEKKMIWQERFKEWLVEQPIPNTADEWKAARKRFHRLVPLKSIQVQGRDFTRDDFKRALFADVFYGRMQVLTPLTKLFAAEFFQVYQFILAEKKPGYEELARTMQRAEAEFMLGTVCKRLFEYHPDVPVVTVHDSISTTPEHVALVERVVLEEFTRIGINPTLK